VSRVGVVVLALGLWISGCSPRRHIDLEFTDAQSGSAPLPQTVSDIQRVDVAVYDGNDCVCADLDNKPGCMTSDQVSTISFDPTKPDRTGGGFPDGKLTIHVAAFDAMTDPIGLRVACWCVPDLADQTLVFPLGSPTAVAGQGCQ
jgi:hypothetical protein